MTTVLMIITSLIIDALCFIHQVLVSVITDAHQSIVPTVGAIVTARVSTGTENGDNWMNEVMNTVSTLIMIYILLDITDEHAYHGITVRHGGHADYVFQKRDKCLMKIVLFWRGVMTGIIYILYILWLVWYR